MKKRTARVNRTTRETAIHVSINLDGRGASRIRTGVPFMDHMLTLVSKHSLVDLTVRAKGDLEVDDHHTVEDLGLAVGTALDKALGDRKGIARYGQGVVPMDEALASVTVDLGGRPYLVMKMACRARKIRDFDLHLIEEFMRALCTQGRFNLHIGQAYGRDPHHAYESVFKALGRALREACARDPRVKGCPSSKGRI